MLGCLSHLADQLVKQEACLHRPHKWEKEKEKERKKISQKGIHEENT